MEQLREQERALQESRLEQEEDMWRLHEAHRAEVEQERRLLKSRLDEDDHTRAETELELEETRRKLAEEQALCKCTVCSLVCIINVCMRYVALGKWSQYSVGDVIFTV